MQGTNTLAFYKNLQIATVKSFKTWTPEEINRL